MFRRWKEKPWRGEPARARRYLLVLRLAGTFRRVGRTGFLRRAATLAALTLAFALGLALGILLARARRLVPATLTGLVLLVAVLLVVFAGHEFLPCHDLNAGRIARATDRPCRMRAGDL